MSEHGFSALDGLHALPGWGLVRIGDVGAVVDFAEILQLVFG